MYFSCFQTMYRLLKFFAILELATCLSHGGADRFPCLCATGLVKQPHELLSSVERREATIFLFIGAGLFTLFFDVDVS